MMLARLPFGVVLTLASAATASSSIAAAQTPAFPGAEGFGANTPGGRGGTVLLVTNLDDSGPGSFRDAVEQEGARIVVFRVSGTIAVERPIKIEHPHLTIAGQSAPGGGIALRNAGNTRDTLKIQTHDVVLRHLRIRPGAGGESDGLILIGEDVRDIMIDHSSISWGVDETVSFWANDPANRITDVTIQDSIIAEGLDCSTHPEGCHSKGLMTGYADRISLHRNLFASNGARSPLLLGGDVEMTNNVVANWGGSPVKVEGRHAPLRLNFVRNYIVPGEDSDLTEAGVQVKTSGVTLHLEGNYASHSRPDDGYPEDAVVSYRAAAPLVAERFAFPEARRMEANEAYLAVLGGSGATLPERDTVDARIVAGVRDGTGRIINAPEDVGGWPDLSGGIPPQDVDADGMPDIWEDRYGLAVADAADNVADLDGDGYGNVEEYLNGTDPTDPDNGKGGEGGGGDSSPPTNGLSVDAGEDLVVADEDGNGGQSVELVGTGVGPVTSYTWTSASRVLSDERVATPWLTVGMHDITLIAADNGGRTDEDTVRVTVEAPEVSGLFVDAGADIRVRDENGNGGESVRRRAAIEGEVASLSWTLGADALGTTDELSDWFRVGTHEVVLTATGADGRTVEDRLFVTVDP